MVEIGRGATLSAMARLVLFTIAEEPMHPDVDSGAEHASLTDEAGAIVVVAASAGGIAAISELLRALPADLPAAIALVQHRSATPKSILAEILQRTSRMPTRTALEGERIQRGVVYIAPADMHLTITKQRRFHLVGGLRICHTLSSANPLFDSASRAFGGRVLAIVLTGGDSDGTDGVQSVASAGGVVIAQDPTTAFAPAMPSSAIGTGAVAQVLPLADIAPAIVGIVGAWARETSCA